MPATQMNLKAVLRSLSAGCVVAATSIAAAQSGPPSTVPTKPPRDVMKPSWPLPGTGKSAADLVKVRAGADVHEVSPGETFLLGFIFEIEPHWHIYWKDPGVSGGPTRINVKAPKGFEVGRTLFPRPRAFREDGGDTYGYENRTVIFVEVTAPIELHGNQAAFSADISYMVCKDICLLGQSHTMVTLATGLAPAKSPAPTIDPLILAFKRRLPDPLGQKAGADVQFDGRTLNIQLPSQRFDQAMFFPVEMPGVTYDDASVETTDGVVRVRVLVDVNPQNAQGRDMIIAGLVALGDDDDDPCYEFEIPAAPGEPARDRTRLVDPSP